VKRLSFLLCTLGLLAWSIESAGAAAARPNIVLILADDLGYSDVGCFGGEIQTPHLDRLAARGIRFTQFYNSAKCEPTRASLISGQYWQDAGLGIKKGLTMGEAMRESGYATFAVGKWHLDGNPVQRGFDRYFGHLSGASDYFKGNPSHHLDEVPLRPANDGRFYTTDANADYAITFITESHRAHPQKPFFLYLAFNAPHSPLQAWPEDIRKYRGKYLDGWDRLRVQRYERQLALGVMKPEWALSPRPATIPPWDTLTAEEKDFEDLRMAIYAAMVDRMDQAIGRVMAKLDELGQTENTVVIFLSDNGASPFDHGAKRSVDHLNAGTGNLNYGLGWASLSSTPFRHYKRNMFNGGSCTPFIVHWPAGLKHPGTFNDQPAHIIDLMATFVDLSGKAWPARFAGKDVAPLPGRTLRPFFSGDSRPPHPELYFQLFDHRAVIAGNLKLVSDWNRPWQLFDLAADRTELHDLAPAQPESAARLEKLWTDWAAKAKTPVRSAGGEPVYRHLHDVQESFLGGGSSGEADGPAAAKAKRTRAERRVERAAGGKQE